MQPSSPWAGHSSRLLPGRPTTAATHRPPPPPPPRRKRSAATATRQRQTGLKPLLAHAALHSEDLPDYFTGTDLSNLASDNDSHKAAKAVLDNLLSLGLLGGSFSSPREGVGGGRKIWFFRLGVPIEDAM